MSGQTVGRPPWCPIATGSWRASPTRSAWQLSSLDPNKPQVNALLKLVEAFEKNVPLMIVDTEFDPATGDVHDLAVVVSNWNGVVIDSKQWQQQPKLHTTQFDEWQEYINEHKKNLVVCWGSPELELFARAGRRIADGSDGFDVREAVLQVLPGMRNLVKAENALRFATRMNFLTPVFGIRAKAHHTALRDCEAEAVVMTAFVRYIGRYVVRNLGMPPPPTLKLYTKRLAPPCDEDDDNDVFE